MVLEQFVIVMALLTLALGYQQGNGNKSRPSRAYGLVR